MSVTYHIGCLTCKEDIWIGQSGTSDPENYFYLYSAEENTMRDLARFLAKHRASPLGILSNEPDHVLVFGNSESFEGFSNVHENNKN